MKINKELMKGSTSILILTLLKSEDMYGYQITQELERRSDSTFEMKEGTLYPMLHALEKKVQLSRIGTIQMRDAGESIINLLIQAKKCLKASKKNGMCLRKL
jgi:PadR family transcriptional regulator PadR